LALTLKEAQDKAWLAVADMKKMYTLFTGDTEPYEDISVFGDDGNYAGHEIIRYDGPMINLIENGTLEGYRDKDGKYPIDHLHEIMSKYFEEWDRENHFCLNVYGIEEEEDD